MSRYFLITAQVPHENGHADVQFNFVTEKRLFINQQDFNNKVRDAVIAKDPTIIISGNPIIKFIMELSKTDYLHWTYEKQNA
jgi:hypothetical protein